MNTEQINERIATIVGVFSKLDDPENYVVALSACHDLASAAMLDGTKTGLVHSLNGLACVTVLTRTTTKLCLGPSVISPGR